MAYNLTAVEDTTNIYDFIRVINNDIAGQLPMVMILGVFWIILYIAMLRYEMRSVMVASSFIVTIIATLVSFAGLLQFWYVFIPMISLFGSLLAKLFVE